MAKPKTPKDRLGTYRDKRDPTRTPEPFTPPPSSRAVTFRGGFVVHQHDATRRHFDLRLEIAGALESFALPRGPTLDPEEKHLAIHTETHPLDYLDFEDVIPAGNYGAGPMIAWDAGAVRFLESSGEQGLVDGKLDFELSGFKLRGRFALIATGRRTGDDKQWLLIKKKDAHARPGANVVDESPRSIFSGLTVEELASRAELGPSLAARAASLGAPAGDVDAPKVEPMLCALVDRPELEAEGWLYELKLDGVRIVADKRGPDVRLFYRSGRGATASYPEIAHALGKLPLSRVVLDGEIVAFDPAGRPSFARLARRIHVERPGDVRLARSEVPVVYLAFDLLALEGHDLRALPLRQRKELLAATVRGRGFVRALDHLERNGRALYDLCVREKLEGIVAKRASAPYREGKKRTGDWVKVKCEREDDFVVVGTTRGEGSRGKLGALDLATWDAAAERFVVRGKAGSGLDDDAIAALLARLAPLECPAPTAAGDLERAPRGRTHVRPEIVVSVRYLGWSDDGRLRFPVFRGVRADVAPRECTAAPHSGDLLANAPAAPRAEREGSGAGASASGRRARLTNPTKVFFPEDGFTKRDVYEYYGSVAEHLLPYLRDRPVVLVRYPDGIHGKSFFQWNVPRDVPRWVRTIALDKHDDETRIVHAFLVNDVDTLLYVANLGAIPIHVLAAREPALEQCDFVTIDFDVGTATLRDAVTLARTLRTILDGAGLPSFPKTSGQTGLHVLVPAGGIPFDAARTLAELLGRLVTARHPELATMERTKNERGKRVYVDTGQTGRSRTIVAPYALRAAPGAKVSTPLTWDEVGPALDPGRFTLATVPARLAASGDPMRALLSETPDLGAALAYLSTLVARRGAGE